jgi:hypothetical protein
MGMILGFAAGQHAKKKESANQAEGHEAASWLVA